MKSCEHLSLKWQMLCYRYMLRNKLYAENILPLKRTSLTHTNVPYSRENVAYIENKSKSEPKYKLLIRVQFRLFHAGGRSNLQQIFFHRHENTTRYKLSFVPPSTPFPSPSLFYYLNRRDC